MKHLDKYVQFFILELCQVQNVHWIIQNSRNHKKHFLVPIFLTFSQRNSPYELLTADGPSTICS